MRRKLIYLTSFVLVLGLALTGTANAQDPNLVGWWKLDGDVLDSSGNGRNGTIYGDPQWVPGADGDALEFDGDDYVIIDGYKGVVGDGTNTPAWSVAAWVKTTDNGEVVGWGSGGGGNRMEFRINSGRTRAEGGNGNTQGDTTMNDGEWHHIVVTVAPNSVYSSGINLHLDGQFDTRANTDSDPWHPVADFDVIFGQRYNQSSSRWFTGAIDDVRIYDRELTQGDIRGLNGLLQSFAPDPADGALLEVTVLTLKWTPGPFAASHNVYFGDNLDDVAAGTGDTFKGNQTELSFDVGVPEALVPGTRYYWRIDDVEADGTTIHTGDVWSFFIPPFNAYDPEPPDGATFARTELLLTWMPGLLAMTHDIYFGENLADVSDGTTPTASGPDPNYATGPLANEATYYWRVDENDGVATHKGDVWSFTTMPAVSVTAEPNLVALWTCDEGPGAITAVDQSGQGNNGVLRNGTQFVAEGKVGGALNFDGIDDYVAIENVHYSSGGHTEVSVCAWIRSSSAANQAIVSFDRNEYYRLQIGGEAGGDGLLGWEVMTDTGQVDTDEAANWPANTGLVNDGLWHHVAGVFDNGTLTMYIDARPREPYVGGATFGSGNTRYGFLSDGSEAEEFDGARNTTPIPFDGDMDEVCIYDKALSEAEIIGMAISLEAWSPIPVNGATGVGATPTLSWFAGANTAGENGHELYISADANAVTNRTAEKIVLSEPSYSVTTPLDLGTHYWAVDQVEADGVTKHEGDTWSFTVSAIITVGPIESLDAIANPADNVTLIVPLAINGIPMSEMVLGTTTADYEKWPEHPAADADNLDLAKYASLDEATVVRTVFAVPVTTIFILERGANDSGFFQPIDADGNPMSAAVPFTAADFQFPGTETLQIQGQKAGGTAIVAEVPINGLEIYPPTDGVLGIDPAVIAAIAATAE